MVLSYLKYTLQGLPTHEAIPGYEAVPDFPQQLLFWSIFFIIVFQGSSLCLKTLWPKWYTELPDRKKREYPSYLTCTVHHLYVVPRGYYHIYLDFMRTPAELAVVQYATFEATIFPWIIGYLIADTVCFALPELLKTGSFEFLAHHILSIWLGTASVYGIGHCTQCSPHLCICESANLFFNAAWIIRTFGDEYKEIAIVKFCELMFAILFFFTRVVNLPLILSNVYFSPYSSSLKGAQYTFFPIVFLQFFWFYKIVSSLFSRGGKKDGKKEGDKKKKGAKEEEENHEFSNKEKTS